MAKSQSPEDLEVYQLAFEFAVACDELTRRLPKHEFYEEGSQLRRSAKAIGANIVEGFGRRRYKADFVRFLTTAHASCNEAIYHLRMLQATGSANSDVVDELLSRADELGRKLHRFRDAVERGHKSGTR